MEVVAVGVKFIQLRNRLTGETFWARLEEAAFVGSDKKVHVFEKIPAETGCVPFEMGEVRGFTCTRGIEPEQHKQRIFLGNVMEIVRRRAPAADNGDV